MPVEFLTDEQATAFGSFADEPTRPELERFFFLDDEDRKLIAKRRGDHNRLGFALQMCTVRYIGLFLEDPLAVPWPVVEHLAAQLEVEDASQIKRYTERQMTAYEHAWEIREAYGYHQYEDHAQGRKFRSFLHGRAWTAHAEGPKALFDHSVGWLRRNRVLLPGVSVLARQVAEVRRIAEERLHATVAKEVRRADAALPGDLVATLKTPEGKRYSELERMRRPPTRTTGTAMKGALQRVEDIAAFHLGRVKLDKIPPNRLSALARYGLGTKAAKLERASEPKRTAMLTAVMRYLEAKAIDDALDLFEILMATRLISAAKRSTDKQRLSTLPQLEKASRLVARAAAVFIEELELIEQTGCDVDVAALWAALEEVAPRAALSSAAYLRSDTIAAANAALIEAQGRVPVVEFWGKGLLASVDGLRFVVPTRTINAAPSPKYFAKKKGITWLNAINDQVIGIGQMVVPGTPRDSLFILDALLNLDGGVKPEMVATDNASYSDMVFGIFKMLGYRFSPRFKDLEDQRFWKAQMPGAEAAGGYGPLEAIARNKVNVKKVITHWPDMLRVAGSLVTNQVRAYDLLRMFGRGGHPTPLGQAFAEYGRIAKTLHLLAVVDPMDDTYRRQMHKQLTVQESRHKLAREICHGKKGTIHQAYRDGMEDQLGSLGLVLNAVVLWTTRYIDAAVAQLRAEGHEIRDEDVARLSPLKHKNLNVLGRYSFTASTPAGGGLRPLRDPETVELDEDDDGQE